MKIFVACPAPPHSRKGNRITGLRWARILKNLGHRVIIEQSYTGTACDLLIALHARRSHPAITCFRRLHPKHPIVLAMTGTDLYRDIHTSRDAKQSLESADRIIVLQSCARTELPNRFRNKVRVIYQSAQPTPRPPRPSRQRFDVCVLGHLREEKDPFRTALALRLLPAQSKIRVTHAGEALSPVFAKRAVDFAARDPRYRWVGEIPRWRARRLLAGSRLMVLSSRMEGGANVISEAIVDGVPILASKIPGSIGMLSSSYPGFFPVGNAHALARLLARAEGDPGFYGKLKEWCSRLAPQFHPARESAAWKDLLEELLRTHADQNQAVE